MACGPTASILRFNGLSPLVNQPAGIQRRFSDALLTDAILAVEREVGLSDEAQDIKNILAKLSPDTGKPAQPTPQPSVFFPKSERSFTEVPVFRHHRTNDPQS